MTQRDPRQRNPAYLAFVRTKPCCVCYRAAPSEAAHIRMASPEHGKPITGMGTKPHDRWSVPLCARHHRTGPLAQHSMGEADFWRMHGLDPFQIALDLFAECGTADKATTLRIRQKVKVAQSGKRRANLSVPQRPIQSRPFPKVSRPFRSARP